MGRVMLADGRVIVAPIASLRRVGNRGVREGVACLLGRNASVYSDDGVTWHEQMTPKERQLRWQMMGKRTTN